jgi:hypothetical protein
LCMYRTEHPRERASAAGGPAARACPLVEASPPRPAIAVRRWRCRERGRVRPSGGRCRNPDKAHQHALMQRCSAPVARLRYAPPIYVSCCVCLIRHGVQCTLSSSDRGFPLSLHERWVGCKGQVGSTHRRPRGAWRGRRRGRACGPRPCKTSRREPAPRGARHALRPDPTHVQDSMQ